MTGAPKPIFLGIWRDGDIWDVLDAFEAPRALDGADLLLAAYGEIFEYLGSAFVLFRRDGKLWEVNGSHCSCSGLEGQWEPEETSLAALATRLDAGHFDGVGDGKETGEALMYVLMAEGGR